MKKTLKDYKEIIKTLPIKNKYTKEELLTKDFLIDKDNNIEIYYTPHNEHFNKEAKIFIVGITPGFQQMSTAISTARKELENTDNIEDIQYKCKVAARFSGSLRKNIISMLDDLQLNEIMNVNSSSELFDEKDYLLHTVSLIPYPVFVKKENYTGHTPKLIKNEFLMSRVVLAAKKKRYFSSIRLREGDEIWPEKIDLKGHDFMKSTATEETKKKFVDIIKKRIISSKDIDVVKILNDIEDFESEIIQSLKDGEKKYLIPISVKELEAYSEPLRMQGVRAVIAWNYFYPDIEIELPTKVDIVKVTLTEDRSIEKLKREFPDIYKILDKDILNNPDTRISSKGLSVIAIPRNIEKIPEWIIPFIDYDTISYNVLNKFYPVLESLGLDTIKTSKKEYFSNILNI